MQIHIPIFNLPDTPDKELIFDIPTRCPHCGLNVLPRVLSGVTDEGITRASLTIQCTACEKFYFVTYNVKETYDDTCDIEFNDLEFDSIYPASILSNLPHEMFELYPEFAEIYEQAFNAEKNQLNKIVGMGYRRALEFLVKNYTKSHDIQNSVTIEKESLAKSINRIPYPTIQNLARACSWIGNDETHTIKKLDEYGIDDMKSFIISLCHLIIAENTALVAEKIVNNK